ncbi:hypothetical protein ZOD2009_00310 [Haladaptatus paucihalophilus DX253]|uniref:Uncharacterized protein n=1 Tax=Haladaptatus paucihalophilus DX253 TaxID=797209 RepID=E7QMP4_HALPU|nr:hypothetical protein ZOD2009_00310 [Haladaptatus paucihalophilus DX253]
MIESVFQIIDLSLLFDQDRDENGSLDEQWLVNRAGIGMQLSILEESIKNCLISWSKCSAIRVPSGITMAALHHYR